MDPDRWARLRAFYVPREFCYQIVQCPEDALREPEQPITYWLAGNGVFISSANAVFRARRRLAACAVKGLLPIEEYFELRIPKVPAYWLDASLLLARAAAERPDGPHERMLYLYFSPARGEFELIEPPQTTSERRVTYHVMPEEHPGGFRVLDLHSHHEWPPFFSATDRTSSTGVSLYAVVGNLDRTPRLALSVGLYGSLFPLAPADLFDIDSERDRSLRVPDQALFG